MKLFIWLGIVLLVAILILCAGITTKSLNTYMAILIFGICLIIASTVYYFVEIRGKDTRLQDY